MDLLWYLLGGALIAGLVRCWQLRLRWAALGAYLTVAGAFFSGALATSALQVPTDIAYGYRPWQQTLPAPAGTPRNALLYDVVTQMLPFRTLVRERLLHGEAPLWAHEVGAGQPLLGNAQSAPFAPLHLLALPLPPLRAMTLAAAWQTLLALLLMHALVRALGGGEAGAAMAALGYAFSTYLVAWAYYPIGMAACWVPGVLLGLVALRRGERGAMAGLVVCALGLSLSGHPESLAHAALASAVAVAALLASSGEGPPRAWFLSRLALATGLAAALAAPVLLPFLEVMRESERFAFIAESGGVFPPPPWLPGALRVLIDPLAYGSPRDGDWNGPLNFNELCTGWVGLLPLAVAIAAASLGARRAWLPIAAVLALGTAFGAPPLIALFHGLPGLDLLPPARLRLLAVLALSLAAGLSLEALVARRRGRWVLAGCIVALAIALLVLPPPGAPWQRAWWIVTLAGAVVAVAALLLPPLRRWFPWVAMAAVALDVTLLGVRYNPLVPAALDLAPPPVLAPLLAMPQRAAFRTTSMVGDLLPNLAAMYGLADPRFYDPMHPWAVRQVIGPALGSGSGLMAVLDPATIAVGSRGTDAPARPMLDYLGVRYMLLRPAGRLPFPWRRAWSATGGRMWENPAAMPLFTMPARIERVGGHRQAIARAAKNRDFRAVGFVESDARLVERAVATSVQRGDVRVSRIEPNGFTLDVETGSGGIVVSSVSLAKGWRVAVGKEAVEPLRVNGAFVGFAVPPGRHRVVVDYRPAGWTWGLRLAALGLVVVVVTGVAARRRRPPAAGL